MNLFGVKRSVAKRKRKILRSKTFNTFINGKEQPGNKKSIRFAKSRKEKDVWSETYAVGKNKRIKRRVVYWRV